MKNKIMIIVIALVVGIIIGSSVYYINKHKNVKDDPSEANEEIKIVKAKQESLDKLEFNNFFFEKEGDKYIGYLSIFNNTDDDIELGKFKLEFKNKKGKVNTAEVYSLDTIKKNGVIDISFMTDFDLSDVESIDYVEIDD